MDGEPRNPATNLVHRAIIEFQRRPDLLHPARVHHDDTIGHCHRLDLIVRDINNGRPQRLMQRLDLGAHLHAQLGVEIGKRLVEQEKVGFSHNGAAHGDALALAARKLAGKAVEVIRQV